LLPDAIDHDGCGNAGHLQGRRHDVDHVVELPAGRAYVLDPGRPRDRHALTGAAEEGWDLLRPFVRRVKRPGPPDRIVGVRLVRTPGVVPRHLLGCRQLNAVEWEDFVRCTGMRAFRRSAVVATDV